MAHELPELNYYLDALEPHIDAKTMEIHHGKHHQAYVNNLNSALEGLDEFANMNICELVMSLDKLPDDKRTAVRNNGGGHLNHSLFWKIIAPESNGGGGEPEGKLAEAINENFGGLDAFKKEFTQACMTRFGSGWAWLCICDEGKLKVCSTPNQDNPLMGKTADTCGCKPILGLDVWEHAYYLNYQNRRPDYINAFWNIVNWKQVGENYDTHSN